MSIRFQYLYLETLPDATVTAVPVRFFDTLAAVILYWLSGNLLGHPTGKLFLSVYGFNIFADQTKACFILDTRKHLSKIESNDLMLV